MPEQSYIGHSVVPEKPITSSAAVPDNSAAAHAPAGARAALAAGIVELQRLQKYPSSDAVQRATTCFVQAAYACHEVSQWSAVLNDALRALRSHSSRRLDAALRVEMAAASLLLEELRDSFDRRKTAVFGLPS